MKKNHVIAIGICFITAFVTLLICSRSSFLYPCNDWNDANSYFTMGKAMMNGQVIYRDLYDQKGPYLYLIYGIAYLMSHTSFLGVFVLEILSVSIFLYAGYKLIRLYCEEEIAYFLIPLLAAVTLSSKSFYWGGAAEEFCIPMMALSLFFSVKYFKEQFDSVPTWRMLLLNGIFAGIILMIKYTLAGFYFAWMAMMAIAFLLKKDWKGFFKGCLFFLFGIGITMLPWLLYLGINGALDDWYQCYIYNNIMLYSNLGREAYGIGQRIYDLAKILLWLILDNMSYFIFIIVGVLFTVISFKNRWIEKINIVMLCGFLFLGIYIGGSSLPYYSIPLLVFTVLGLIPIGMLLHKVWEKINNKMVWKIGSLVMIIAGCIFAYQNSMNTYFMKQDKESYFLYKFEEIVSREENPTLVTVGCLDAGLYTVADVMPTCRFFQTNGIGFEDMFVEQRQYVADAKTQFVLTTDIAKPDGISENYELVGEESYKWDEYSFKYYLFKRRE